LFSKPFYRAIGEEDNRDRSERRVFTVKNKPMCHGLVLANRRHQFLATEPEKVELIFKGDDFDHLFTSWKTEGAAAISRQIANQIPDLAGVLTRHFPPVITTFLGAFGMLASPRTAEQPISGPFRVVLRVDFRAHRRKAS
jgi:hypothetical protein